MSFFLEVYSDIVFIVLFMWREAFGIRRFMNVFIIINQEVKKSYFG